MEIRNSNGTLKTVDELYEEAASNLADAIEWLDEDEALEFGNKIRYDKGYYELHKNEEDEVNEALYGEEPWDVLQADWESGWDYFTYDGSFTMTDDIWEGLNSRELAEEIIEGNYRRYLPDALKAVVDEFEKAKKELDNPYRTMAKEVIRKFTNGEADVSDLLQTLDKLVKTDEAWAKGV